MKRPAYQFYPGDWLNDTGLRACSLAARGLWIDMNCIMHQGHPYGYLTWSAKDRDEDVLRPIPDGVLARIVGSREEEVVPLLAELEDAGVFSRTADGVIYSRRMVRDENARESRAAGGYKSLENPNVPRPKVNRTPGRIPLPASSTGSSESSVETSFGGSPSSSSSSSSSEEVTDASVAGRALAEQLGVPNLHFQEQLTRQLRMEATRTGETLQQTVERMVGQWKRYNGARSQLNFPVSSAQRFFESGTWQDEALWPWKEGQQPTNTNPDRYFRGGASDV